MLKNWDREVPISFNTILNIFLALAENLPKGINICNSLGEFYGSSLPYKIYSSVKQ